MAWAIKLKSLHLCSSIDELQKKADLQKDPSGKFDRLFESLKRMYDEGKLKQKDGDEELAFIYFYRGCVIADAIRNCCDYSLADTRKQEVVKLTFKRSMNYIEELKSSLLRRYRLTQEKDIVERQANNQLIEQQAKTISTVPDSTDAVGVDLDGCNEISAQQLYQLQSRSDQPEVLLLDFRPADKRSALLQFKTDRFTCVHIPRAALIPGCTAKKLELNLQVADRCVFSRRHNADYVILMDCKSNVDVVHPGSAASILSRAISEYDNAGRLRRSPLVLAGGFDSWKLHYPMHTVSLASSLDNVDSEDPQDSDYESLSSVSYPDLEDYFSQSLRERSVHDEGFSEDEQPSFGIRLQEQLPARDLKPNGNATDNKYQLNEQHSADIHPIMGFPPVPSSTIAPTSTCSVTTETVVLPQPTYTSSAVSGRKLVPSVDRSSKPSFYTQKPTANGSLQNGRSRVEVDVLTATKIEPSHVSSTVIQVEQTDMQDASVPRFDRSLKPTNGRVKNQVDDAVDAHLANCNRLDALGQQLTDVRLSGGVGSGTQEETGNWHSTRSGESAICVNEDGFGRPKHRPRSREPKTADHSDPSTDISSDHDANQSVHASTSAHSGHSTNSTPRSDASQHCTTQLSHHKLNNDYQPESVVPDPTRAPVHRLPTLPDRRFKPPDLRLAELEKFEKHEMTLAYQSMTQNSVRSSRQLHKALTGLYNLGNTCFMNSILQCLSNTTYLADYFTSRDYYKHINRENRFGSGGKLATNFCALIYMLHQQRFKYINPLKFKERVTRVTRMFGDGAQHDAQEFLTMVLDGLHEDLNLVKQRRAIPEQNNENKSLEQAANEAWRNLAKFGRSRIYDIFQGQLLSTIRCCSCRTESRTFDSFTQVSLELPNDAIACTLQECFGQHLKPEAMRGDAQWKCSSCKDLRDSTKKIDLWKLPEVLIIHLKRFEANGYRGRKLETAVDYPVLMDLRETLHPSSTEKRNGTEYQLYAVCNHYGDLGHGHYTSFCYNSETERWFLFDDEKVSSVTSREVITHNAYILFYKKTAAGSAL